ncbi:hypothetical protein EV182_006696, partial [Spiromyces aspiralis]
YKAQGQQWWHQYQHQDCRGVTGYSFGQPGQVAELLCALCSHQGQVQCVGGGQGIQ